MIFLPDTFAGSSDCSRCCEGRYLLGAEVVRGDVVVCITRIGCITCCHFRRTMSHHCSPLPRGCTKYGTLRTPHGPNTTHPIVLALAVCLLLEKHNPNPRPNPRPNHVRSCNDYRGTRRCDKETAAFVPVPALEPLSCIPFGAWG